ncbi:MAG: hypothetical protein H7Y27_11070 [Gemmatimonadaceae bacterium]|nr:hypothetical protein [Chitinophagaceae bacterium]
MRKLFTLILIISAATGYAQQFNNEWIDPNKTYYKFKSPRTGLFRISQAAINSIGLGATPVNHFKLFRNGREVALYTSVNSGALPANGYIEFWGERNDGKPDRVMYRDPNYQHHEKYSLQTDTVVYFLTVHTTSANLRFTEVANDVAGNALPAETYFMHTLGRYFHERINPGFAAPVGEYVYSSSYDVGENWSTNEIYPLAPRQDDQANLFPYLGAGIGGTLKFGASGNALNSRKISVRLNNTQLIDTICDYFNEVKATVPFPIALLNTGTSSTVFKSVSSDTTNDRFVVSHYELNYPRSFNFGGATNFPFKLEARNNGYYLEITNFSAGSPVPVLYDLTYQERYIADVSTPGMLKFAVSGGTSDRDMLLVSEDPSNIATVDASQIVTKNFVNFNSPANQSNYIIISNPILYSGPNGSNPVEEYRIYRSSATGGGYNAKIVDINELVDQFAYGIKKHPLSVKNFLRFARAKFAATPQYALLIGRGISYNEYYPTQGNPISDRLNLIPTFGWPASDNLLGSADGANPVTLTPIGRIGAISPVEVADYLEKVKEYESAQQNSPNTIAGRGWMKNIMQITGASDSYLGTVLCNYMETYKQIIKDTLVGANVSIFCKNSTNPVEQLSNEKIAELFEEGLSLITYFGHSSSTTLEFNIDNPQNYNNQGKYPVFSVNGCNAGNFFTFTPQRLSFNETLSEKFTLAKQRGGIAFIASTHFGIVNYLNIYINNMYSLSTKTDYGASLGKINHDAAQQLLQIAGASDFYARLHAEEITLHGDPALKLNFQPLPDYVIEEPQVQINPQFISVAEDKFKASIKLHNIGRAVNDSIVIEIKQQFPDNTTGLLLRKKIRGVYNVDSISIDVPIQAARDKGLNKLIITIDADNAVPEKTEINNTVTKEFFIYEDEARPAFPYGYSIVSQQNTKFYASTANPFSGLKQYVLEMDTTEAFNSPLKVSKTLTSVGGMLEFDPGMTFQDSTVYYWRTSFVPGQGGEYRWNTTSFIYLNAAPSAGFNQSHYFQQLKSTSERVFLDADRQWKYQPIDNNIYIRNAIYPTSGLEDNEFTVSVNGDTYIISACVGSSIIFHVFDPITFKPWKNTKPDGTSLNLSGSGSSDCGFGRSYNIEFSTMSSDTRFRMMKFMDSIPAGAYVVVRNIPNADEGSNTYAKDWQADTTLFGSNKSLYHSLLGVGMPVDSFNRARAYAFVYQKGNPTYPPKFKISDGIYDKIVLSADAATPDSIGSITSPAFGPAKNWKQVHWRGTSTEASSTDLNKVEVIGVPDNGPETVLYTLDNTQQDFDISAVSSTQYPRIKLKLTSQDSVNLTPFQLRYWRLDYDPLPEGALIPNIFFRTKDTLEIGEKLNFGIAFKNISAAPFDSVKMKMYVLDKANVPHNIVLPKRKPLIAGDSIRFEYEIDTKDYPGMNTLYLDFNPENDQPEQFHFNNFLFRNFYVRPDNINPLLDVTFDNVHILNRDIVSARPHIQIKLKDEAKYMLLNDTAGMTVQIRFPDNNNLTRTYRIDGDTLKFTPAANGTDNTASLDFYPSFLEQINPEGDEYELIVSGKDRSSNKTGSSEYKVTFRVISKPMISNLLNYPNPFTTSTAFVFTITGSEVPQNMKIQILTVTGKIVREITKQELGPLHIGRNITEFKWDGNDQFGQRLANGVYLYRFVTTLNGQKMEKFKDGGDDTDKYFNKGYGKMYLMR